MLELAKELHVQGADSYRGDDSQAALDTFRHFAVRLLRAEQDRDLADFRVRFDNHYLESSLFEEGRSTPPSRHSARPG